MITVFTTHNNLFFRPAARYPVLPRELERCLVGLRTTRQEIDFRRIITKVSHQVRSKPLLRFIGEKGRMRECERLNLLLQGGDDIRMTVPEAGHRGSTTHVEVTATIAILEVHTRSGNRVWVALPRHTVEN